MTAVRAGNFDGARALLARARRSAGDDPNLLALISLSDAYLEAELHGVSAAIPACRDLLDAPGLTEETRGRIWAQLGLLQMRGGDAPDAVVSFSEAVGRLQESPEHLGRALLNRGTLHLGQWRTAEAVHDFRDAAGQFERSGLTVQAAKAAHNVGYASLLGGDLVDALGAMEAAAHVLAPLSAVSRAQCDQDRAEVLLAAGRPREAARALHAAADAYGRQRLRRFQAECEYVLARTLLREDPREARVVARRSARRFASHGAPTWANRAEALAIAASIRTGERAPSVLTRADELEVSLREEGLASEADQLALIASRLVLRRGDLDEAEARVAKVRLTKDAPIPLQLLRHEVRADLATARHQRARARREVTRGLTALHRWQSSFGSLDLQSTLVGHGRGLAVRGLASALDDGRPELVYEWSERARALVGRVTPVRPPRDEQIAADLAALRQLPPGDRRRSELAERIARHSWAAPGGGEVGDPAPLEELQAGLGPDAALVAYVLGPHDGLAAFVATDRDAAVLDLGDGSVLRNRLDALSADLDMAASRTAGPMADAIRASLRRSLGQVAHHLVEPVLPHVGDRRLVLTPAGSLAGTPWTLLPGLVGRPLTIPSSATQWLRRHDGTPHRRLGLVAGPRVDRAAEEVRRAAASWAQAGGSPEVLLGAEASAADVASLAERVDVLHLAGHGRHSGENPLFSAVELADGPWFGYDIDSLAHTPSTVVLSACELGRVSVRSGEEAVGMSGAWLHAGVHHVLSSPALVADEVACEGLARWHGLVAEGAAPAEALASVGEALRDGPPLPFLCFGRGW
jgi:tetratricopeptide (TPR) repeat protein